MMCEKCWSDAYDDTYVDGNSQPDRYHKLLKIREQQPCSPQEQAGEYWNEQLQCDDRVGRLKAKNIKKS